MDNAYNEAVMQMYDAGMLTTQEFFDALLDDKPFEFNAAKTEEQEIADLLMEVATDIEDMGYIHVRYDKPMGGGGCQHVWKETEGFIAIYKDCVKCGAKWEDIK